MIKAAMIGFLPKEQDAYSVLESYGKLGYSGFEGGNLLFQQGNPKENLKRVQAFGMEPLALHYPIENPPSVGDLIHMAEEIGVTRVVCYCGAVGAYRFGGRETPPDYDEILREAQAFDTAAKALAKEGIDLLFHNHDAEFLYHVRGVPAIYLMAGNTEYLKFEVDCGWVAYAGWNPAAYLRTLGSRVGLVHVKDFAPGKVEEIKEDGKVITMPRFTTPGTGLLDLSGCLEAAAELSVPWAIVEQDFQYRLTQTETLAAAYLNMKETGFVE